MQGGFRQSKTKENSDFQSGRILDGRKSQCYRRFKGEAQRICGEELYRRNSQLPQTRLGQELEIPKPLAASLLPLVSIFEPPQ